MDEYCQIYFWGYFVVVGYQDIIILNKIFKEKICRISLE